MTEDDMQKIKTLYVDEKKSMESIAKIMHISAWNVHDKLHKMGVEIRPNVTAHALEKAWEASKGRVKTDEEKAAIKAEKEKKKAEKLQKKEEAKQMRAALKAEKEKAETAEEVKVEQKTMEAVKPVVKEVKTPAPVKSEVKKEISSVDAFIASLRR